MRDPTGSARRGILGFRSYQVKVIVLASDSAFTTSLEKIRFSRESLDDFVRIQRDENRYHSVPDTTYLLDYPTVYIVHDRPQSTAYVGETTDIRSRTIQHLDADPATREDWKRLAESRSATMYVIGNSLFNKSLTLDIENQLMLYLSGSPAIKELNNRRTNPQNRYYTDKHFSDVFDDIWTNLRSDNPSLFPPAEAVRDSALFKASPCHKLTTEQLDAKREILNSIIDTLDRDEDQQLIFVTGEAGSGKTVLISSLFYDLFQDAPLSDSPRNLTDTNAYLLVNHDEQRIVYREIAKKLGLLRGNADRVAKPTSFINKVDPDDKVDVVLIDEAHLLLTQGNQGYQGKNHLKDILKRARVVVAVYDERQVLATTQYWDPEQKQQLFDGAAHHVKLENQMRMAAAPDTVAWIRHFIDDGIIGDSPVGADGFDDRNYELRVFETPTALYDAIRERSSVSETALSRILATYDWPYSSKSKPPEGGPWTVSIGDFKKPWNRETKPASRGNKNLAWAEQVHTIDEVGSTFTIQGFDLNYAGVILGPAIKYRDGRIVIDPSASANRKATQKRTTDSGDKIILAEELIQNELNVLMTRGVNGLYLFAVDTPLQEALLKLNKRQPLSTTSS